MGSQRSEVRAGRSIQRRPKAASAGGQTSRHQRAAANGGPQDQTLVPRIVL